MTVNESIPAARLARSQRRLRPKYRRTNEQPRPSTARPLLPLAPRYSEVRYGARTGRWDKNELLSAGFRVFATAEPDPKRTKLIWLLARLVITGEVLQSAGCAVNFYGLSGASIITALQASCRAAALHNQLVFVADADAH